MKENSIKLLPVAIMAHNEESVIQRSVESVLRQKEPEGYSIRVIVVANGCNDRTEEIVKLLETQFPKRIVLVSMKEKGKTKAINRAIGLFDELLAGGFTIPYVIFLDADCDFYDKDVLVKIVTSFEVNPQLCAVSANCIPDVVFNSRKDIVAETYRAIYRLGESLTINSISGMGYGIPFNILKKVNFPEIQFNEDMFVAARLDGWFHRNKDIKIVFKTPANLSNEIARRTRQEICTRRYKEYFCYLKEQGVKVGLFENALGEEYKWFGPEDSNWIKAWFKLIGCKEKLFVLVYVSIRMWAKISALWTMAKIKRNTNLDFWKVLR